MGTISTAGFKNWGETVDCKPRHIHFPRTEEEIQEIIRDARQNGRVVRVVGTGHSWTPLAETDDTLICLDNMHGLVAVDPDNKQATCWAGTKLDSLGEALFNNGLAMQNLGDIDKQAIAGVLGTGTHGSGINYGVIPTQVVGVRLIDGTGEIHELTEADGDLFKAAQVSLGVLGIVTQITLQCEPSYNLKRIKKRAPLEQTLSNIDKHLANNRNFELFWFPYAESCLQQSLNYTQAEAEKDTAWKYFVDVVWENRMWKVISEAVRMSPNLSKPVSKFAASGMAAGVDIKAAHRLYPAVRDVRFYEMEYSVERDKGPQVLREIREIVRKQNIRVHYPIEYRYCAGDDILISPGHGGERAFISVHMYAGMDWKPYFNALEPMFQSHGGRPHWGKMHTASAAYLRERYPRLDDFLAVRERLDPDRVFLSPYLNNLLGVAKTAKADTQ